ncbi:BrnA antitoxin family protein [Pannus brasiliensis CCIBt3594]|uniref:BrnA antitoxin family protein n=1 Tax=Pannus brasiliensis CCIBt3594 TaxID=1427578 RepID=A0AAW9QGB0_9CHRO
MNDKDSIDTSRGTALEAMDDDSIDYSDITPLTDEFFEKATLRIPASQADRFVQLDPDILNWFQSRGEDYKTLINSILRNHIESVGEQSAV